jgi:glutamine synthetase
VPGFEAPVNLIYSQRNRSAICRIPVYSTSPKAKRIEYRAPDPSCNPYLAFAALLMAGLDGIRRKIEPPKPIDADLYELHGDEKKNIRNTPGSLAEVLNALEQDHDFLLQGDVLHAGCHRDLDQHEALEGFARDKRCGRIRTSSSCITTRDWWSPVTSRQPQDW